MPPSGSAHEHATILILQEEEEIVEADIETESSEDEEEDIGEMTYKQKKVKNCVF